ncbi:MAG: tail fiber domain-containing protein [Mariniphaga sp.]|nr:tail fiber domain-containing protein [Mariniphaga sp.]
MKKITFISVLGFLILSFTAFSQIKVDSNGNTTIKHGTFSQGNDAVLYLGATDHYIKSVFGYGVTIGTAGMTDWIKLRQYTGCVGLGREPQYALDVSGTIRAQTTIYPSDIRFKTNIQNLENPINKIKQIQGVSYNFSSNDTISQKYNNQSSFNKNFGFIAQDFQKIYPELVYEDSLGYLSIDYISVIPVLLEAMKKQQGIIDDLVARIETVEENCCNNTLKSASLATGTDTKLAGNEAVLYQNTPNPFREQTEIKCYLPEGAVSSALYIFNMQGLQLEEYRIKGTGDQLVRINGNRFNPGMYLYSLVVNGREIDTKRMILTK